MIRKWKLLLVGVSCVMGTAMAQNNPILLFPKGAPGETTKLIEKADADGGKTGGETVLRITNVSEPTITVYPAPDEVATGAAVVVCPGGGYNILAYDLEGDEVCEWLNNLGVTAVLLKYRVPRREGRAKHEAPLQDVQRAIGYVRTHAEEMNLDPQRIGVMGFSAGGIFRGWQATISINVLIRPWMRQIRQVAVRTSASWFILPIWMVKIFSWLRRSKYLLPLPLQ